MFCFAKNFRSGIVGLIALAMAVYTLQGDILAQSRAGSAGSGPQEVQKLLDRIEAGMRGSRKKIEQGSFREAKVANRDSVETLDALLEIFLPLPDRIRRLWTAEQKIAEQTRQLGKVEDDKADRVPRRNQIAALQAGTFQKTQSTVRRVQGQLKGMKQKPGQKGDPHAIRSQADLLKKVKQLLEQSAGLQAEAVEQLGKNKLQTAVSREDQAAAKLEEALKAFQNQQQHQQQQKKKQQKAGQQRSGSQQKNRQQEGRQAQNQQKKGNPSGQDQPASSQNRSQQGAQAEPRPERSLTPRQALKELKRLQKEAEADKRRREKALGSVSAPGRVPTEKDW